MVICPVCGQQVFNKAKVCPHCGKRLRMALWLKIAIAIIVFIVISQLPDISTPKNTAESTAGRTRRTTETTSPAIVDIRPEEQRQFEDVVATYSQQFDKAQNELQESTYRRDRMNAIKALNINSQVNDWTGTLYTLGTNSEGKAHITIRLNNNLSVGTWNNAFSDIGSNTLISMDSDLYKALYDMKTRQKVRFSGTFVRSDTDYFRETSLTIRGAMKNPDFLMQFSSVEAID
jgi:hypothetical protein